MMCFYSWSNPFLVGVIQIHKGLDVASTTESAMLFAQLETLERGNITRDWPIQHAFPMRFLLCRRTSYILTHPITDFPIRNGMLHDPDHLLVSDAGSAQPHTIKGFSKI